MARRARVTVAAGLILLVGLVPLTVDPAAGAPAVLDEASYTENGYAAWEVTMEAGDEVRFEGTAFAEDASMEAVGFWAFDQELGLEYAAVLSHYYGPGNIVHATAGPAGASPVTQGAADGGGFLGITSFEAPEDGVYHLVTLAGADGPNEGSLSILGPESVTVTASSTGPAFLAKPPSFEGGYGASVAAEQQEPYRGAQVRVLQDARYPIDVDGHLVGLFDGDTNTGELEMSVDTPEGTLDGSHLYFLSGEPAGDYTFRVDENVDTWDSLGACQVYSEGFCTQPTIYAFGADVVVP